MQVIDPSVEFSMGASGPLFYDTGKVKIGACYFRPSKPVTQAEVDIQGVLLGHFKPYPGKQKRGLMDRVRSFFA